MYISVHEFTFPIWYGNATRNPQHFTYLILTRRDGFRVVIISTLDPYEYEAALAECIPLGYMQPIYVNPSDWRWKWSGSGGGGRKIMNMMLERGPLWSEDLWLVECSLIVMNVMVAVVLICAIEYAHLSFAEVCVSFILCCVFICVHVFMLIWIGFRNFFWLVCSFVLISLTSTWVKVQALVDSTINCMWSLYLSCCFVYWGKLHN